MNCLWKEPILLGRRGKTLGLDYEFLPSGRMVVNHSYKPYSQGVQRKLDLKELATLEEKMTGE